MIPWLWRGGRSRGQYKGKDVLGVWTGTEAFGTDVR